MPSYLIPVLAIALWFVIDLYLGTRISRMINSDKKTRTEIAFVGSNALVGIVLIVYSLQFTF